MRTNQLLIPTETGRLLRWEIGLLFIGLLFLGGCSQKWLDLSLLTPAADVAEIRVLDRTDRAMRLELVVELVNPNAVDLPLREVDYRISVPGLESFHFSLPPVATLPAEGRQTLRLPAVLEFPAGERALALRITGTVSYEPPGELRRIMTDSGIPLPWSSFSAESPLEAGP